jgi:hypothetical protein
MNECKIPVSLGRIIIALCAVSALAAFFDGAAARAQAPSAKPSAKSSTKGDAKAESVLRRTADFYKKASSFTVEAERSQKIGPIGVKNKISIAFDRPNRFACRTEGLIPGVDVVSDGKKLFLSIGMLQKYSESAAPASIDAMLDDKVVQGALQGILISDLCASDPYERIMKGVKTVAFAGQETIDSAKADHLTFTQDQFDWELWVAADGDPSIRRVSVDLTKSLAKMPGAAQLKNQLKDQKLELIHDFKSWRFDPKLDGKAFAFQPPKGAQKVANLLEGLAPPQQ